jgi:peroxiredoxin
MIVRALIFCLLLGTSVIATAQQPAPPKTNLKIGDPAPDFTLPSTTGEKVKLSDFKGKKNVVLAFYVLAFTGGWTKELKAYQADIAKFEGTDTQVFGISVDSVPANKRFAQDIGVTFPLLSDFKRTVVKDYGIFNEAQGFGNRATFVIDKQGIIQHIDEGNVAIDPTAAIDACNVLTHKKASGWLINAQVIARLTVFLQSSLITVSVKRFWDSTASQISDWSRDVNETLRVLTL